MVKLNVRMPEDLHKAIKLLAEKEKRSLNSEILYILEEHLRQRQGIEQKPQG